MQAYLKKHGPDFSNHSLKVLWERIGQVVTIDFVIQRRAGKGWQTDNSFSSDWTKNWGLWNKDVFEAFLQLRSHESDISAPYLEIQVSPLNQPFGLIITEPRKTYFPPASLTFETQVSLEDKLWTGKMVVTLPTDLKGEYLYGGFFSCLDTSPREFFALNPNSENAPDFHRPELFYCLDEQ
jgi:hypothetical protein